MSKVRIRDGHWIWIGADGGRYGQIKVLGKVEQAHRVSYELFIGEIPEGHGVLHRCDICLCVNPEHLFSGTQMDNMHDMIDKGRRHFDRLLTMKQAQDIREIQGMSLSQLAEIYEVSPTVIFSILHNKSYTKEK